MYNVIDKKKIGDYLNDLIKKKYGTPSDFCRAYLNASDSKNDETEFTNLKNRISAIVHGTLSWQI